MKRLALALAAALAFTSVQAAHAYERHVVVKKDNDALIAGVFGLAAGALVATAIANDKGKVHYVPPRQKNWRHHHFRPHPYRAHVRPWTREWVRYCSSRYRSFDPRTGYFRGFDGRRHFCVAS